MSVAFVPFELRTPRLVLRDYGPSDVDAVQRIAGDPLVVEHLPFGPNTLDETEAFIRRTMESARATPRRTFEVAVAQLATGEVVGGIRLGIQSDVHRDASLGYILRRDLWGRGLITEAARALVGFGFSSLDLHRVWATCGVDNVGSQRVLEKIGMRREAHLREHMQVRGRWRDSYLYAVLEREWSADIPWSGRAPPLTLVVINGPVASGKSSVARELAGLTERSGRRSAVIDLDEVWLMLDHQRPRMGGLEEWLLARRAAAELTDLFFSSGIEVVVCEGPFFTRAEREGYTRHLRTAVPVQYVTLWAPFEVTHERSLGDPHPDRIVSKDPAWLRQRYDESTKLLEQVRATDTIVDTQGSTAREVALRIAAEFGFDTRRTVRTRA